MRTLRASAQSLSQLWSRTCAFLAVTEARLDTSLFGNLNIMTYYCALAPRFGFPRRTQAVDGSYTQNAQCTTPVDRTQPVHTFKCELSRWLGCFYCDARFLATSIRALHVARNRSKDGRNRNNVIRCCGPGTESHQQRCEQPDSILVTVSSSAQRIAEGARVPAGASVAPTIARCLRLALACSAHLMRTAESENYINWRSVYIYPSSYIPGFRR